MLATRSTIWWTIAALCLLTTAVSCLDSSAPERIVRGVITDQTGAPLAGAVVSVGLRHAVTADDGSYALPGLPADSSGPVTATAQGHTAWSLDTATLTGFSTRLRLRAPPPQTGWVSLGLTSEVPTTQDRALWVTSDDGQIVEVFMRAGAREASVQVEMAAGERVFAVFGGPIASLPAVWSPPTSVRVVEGETVTVAAQLAAVAADSVSIGVSPPPAQAAALAVRCEMEGVSLLIGRAQVPAGGRSVGVDLVAADAGKCEVVVSYEIDVGLGPVRHVGFASDIKRDNLGDLTVRMPPEAVLVAEVGDEISWAPLPDADVYDVFLAPRSGTVAGPPIWSATTEGASIRLPRLPKEAVAGIDTVSGELLVRVVARYAPALDIEDNWDWSAYHGYVASPWLPAPVSTLAVWR